MQNFRAKPGTKMARRGRADARRSPLDDRRRAPRAAARASRCRRRPTSPATTSRHCSPPASTTSAASRPVTPDHVNPEAPWPDVARLESACAAAGLTLLPRLAVYPEFLADPETWLSDGTRGPSLAASDGLGLARRERWTTGTVPEPPPAWRGGPPPSARRRRLRRLRARPRARRGTQTLLDEDDATALLSARGPEIELLAAAAADRRRFERSGDRVTYVVCRNVNYTNVCYFKLRLLRLLEGQARREPARPRLPPERRRGRPARRRGLDARRHRGLPAGRDPSRLQRALVPRCCCAPSRRPCPTIHVHAFSPLEVWQGAATAEWDLDDYLTAPQGRRARLAARHRGRDPR